MRRSCLVGLVALVALAAGAGIAAAQVPLPASQPAAEAKAADSNVQPIVNPFSPRSLLNFALQRGPRIAVTLLGAFVLLYLLRLARQRLLAHLERRTREADGQRDGRTRTLVSVLYNAGVVVIVVGAILMLLGQVGINTTPLLGGAAVVGLAVAFGSQNLIRDFFTGFMILLENQYAIDDVVKIGALSGKVERITLRITVLRDLDGTAHFIPNGTIAAVSNMTHEWSRALIEVKAPSQTDMDEVSRTLQEAAGELRADPQYKAMILGDPKLLGVDSLQDATYSVKFSLKTRPDKKWDVKRALLARLKRKFQERNIAVSAQ